VATYSNPIIQALQAVSTKGNNPEAYKTFKADTQKYFLDIPTLSKFAPDSAKYAGADPEGWKAKVMSYLQPQYGNIRDSSTSEYYDYPTNKWLKFNTQASSSSSSSTSSTEGDSPERQRTRQAYGYGSQNPYLEELMGLSKRNNPMSRYQQGPGKRQGMNKSPEYDFLAKLIGG